MVKKYKITENIPVFMTLNLGLSWLPLTMVPLLSVWYQLVRLLVMMTNEYQKCVGIHSTVQHTH